MVKPHPLKNYTLNLINDEPLRNFKMDGLNLSRWARIIAGVAMGTSSPFTIGVFGRWGEGKTSILQLAKQILDESEDAKEGFLSTVEFNAWLYQHEENPLIPLAATLLNALQATDKRGLWFDNVQNALRSILSGLSMKVTAKQPWIGEVDLELDVEKSIKRYEQLRNHWIDGRIQECLYYMPMRLIEEARQKDNNNHHRRFKIIVFIDDLDRCLPNTAIHLLENIKLVLSQPGFLFVMGLDPRFLENYLYRRFKEEFGIDEYHQSQAYLAKIVQLPIWIPPHEKRFNDLINKLIKTDALKKHQNVFTESLIETIGIACDHNPRHLVRFFNDLLVDEKIFWIEHPKERFPYGAFIVSRGIRHQNDSIYQCLIKNLNICRELKTCEDINSFQSKISYLIESGDFDNFEKKCLQDLSFHNSLIRLMMTDSGRKWLSSEETRNQVNDFLFDRFQSVEDKEPYLNRYVLEQTTHAIELLRATHKKKILSGLHILFTLPSCPEVLIDRVIELTSAEESEIASIARIILKKFLGGASPV